jgi:hypothetical protein
MLNVPAALRLQAAASPPDRSRLTLNACANQVERAALILDVAIEGLESLGAEFLAQSYAFHLRQALVRLRGAAELIQPSPCEAATPASLGPGNTSKERPAE